MAVMTEAEGLPTPDLMRLVTEELESGGRVRFAVTGGSMAPFVRHGDVVEVAPLSCELEVGDVVLARTTSTRSVLHRVVRIEKAGVWLRGDAQTRREGPVPAESVLGCAASVSRRGRLLSMDGWWWRIAGRVWVALHPCGPLMIRGVRLLRSAGRNMSNRFE